MNLEVATTIFFTSAGLSLSNLYHTVIIDNCEDSKYIFFSQPHIRKLQL